MFRLDDNMANVCVYGVANCYYAITDWQLMFQLIAECVHQIYFGTRKFYSEFYTYNI